MSKGISSRLAEQREAMANRVAEIGDRAQVAREYGCSLSYVDKSCRLHGIQQHRITAAQAVTILAAMLLTDETVANIAARLQLPYLGVDRIHRLAIEAGIDCRRYRGRPRTYPEGSVEHARRLRENARRGR